MPCLVIAPRTDVHSGLMSRMLTAQRQGKTSFYMQHLGEEAVSCAFARAMRHESASKPNGWRWRNKSAKRSSLEEEEAQRIRK